MTGTSARERGSAMGAALSASVSFPDATTNKWSSLKQCSKSNKLKKTKSDNN
jgi:hypothetical protein